MGEYLERDYGVSERILGKRLSNLTCSNLATLGLVGVGGISGLLLSQYANTNSVTGVGVGCLCAGLCKLIYNLDQERKLDKPIN